MAQYGSSNRVYRGYDGGQLNGYSDYVIDAEGRKRPVISYNPSSYSPIRVQRTEVSVEEVQRYGAAGYNHSYDSEVEALGNYEVTNGRWGRPRSPVYDRPQQVAKFPTNVQYEASQPRHQPPASNFQAYGNNEQTRPTSGQEVRRATPTPTAYSDSSYTKPEPWKDNRVASGRWGRPLSPTQTEETMPTTRVAPSNSNGSNQWTRPTFGQQEGHKPMTIETVYRYNSPTKVEPPREDCGVEELASKVNDWHMPSTYTGKEGSNGHNKLQGGELGYNPYRDYGNSALKTQDGKNYGYNQWRDDDSKQFLEKPGGGYGYGEHKVSSIPIEMIDTSDSWASRIEPLTLGTAVSTAAEAVSLMKNAFQSPPKAAAKPSPAAISASPRRSFMVPPSPVATKREDMPGIIDNNEAQRRYGNSDF